MAEEEVEVSVYIKYHWECPDCSYGFEQEEEPDEKYECPDCGLVIKIRI